MKTRNLSLLSCLVLLLAAPASHAIPFTAHLSGAAEAPPNASPGSGEATVNIDPLAHLLEIDFTFTGLAGPTTSAHLHCCTTAAGSGTSIIATQVPRFPGFPQGVTSGSYSATFDTTLATSWNPAFLFTHGGTPASAEAALTTGLLAGDAYLNIHTSAFPGGEIRGFLAAGPAAAIPEPASAALLGIGLLALSLPRRPTRGQV